MDADRKGMKRTQHIIGAHIASTAQLFPPSVSSSGLLGQWAQLQAEARLPPITATLNATLEPLTATAYGIVGEAGPDVPDTSSIPELLVGASLVNLGDDSDDGRLVPAITPLWRRVFGDLQKDPTALHRLLDPRQFEEFIAGAYREDGWDVTLTPRSGDRGRDVIAHRDDFGGIRILDQVKLFKPGNLVDAEAVRAMWAVLNRDPKASKAVITTTSGFAPGVYDEFADCVPTRLQLKDGKALEAWLRQIASTKEIRHR